MQRVQRCLAYQGASTLGATRKACRPNRAPRTQSLTVRLNVHARWDGISASSLHTHTNTHTHTCGYDRKTQRVCMCVFLLLCVSPCMRHAYMDEVSKSAKRIQADACLRVSVCVPSSVCVSVCLCVCCVCLGSCVCVCVFAYAFVHVHVYIGNCACVRLCA